jgi:predicted ester cyclase
MIDKLKQALLSAWNDRQLWELAAMFRHTVRLFFGPGNQLYSRDALIAAMVDMHAAFPDLEFSIDAIAADGAETSTLRACIRWTIRGTHLGFGRAGTPTGNRMMLTGASIYHLENTTITEIWNVADNGSLMNQLKIDEYDYLQRSAEPEPFFDLQTLFGDTERTSGQDLPDLPDLRDLTDQLGQLDQLVLPDQADIPARPWLPSLRASLELLLTNLIKTIWNGRSPGVISRTHHEACKFSLPAGFMLQRSHHQPDRGLYQAYVYSMLAMFPDARAYIDEIIIDETIIDETIIDETIIDETIPGTLSTPDDPSSFSMRTKTKNADSGTLQPSISAAVRWTLQGVHRGEGYLGTPAGRQLTIPLISEYQIDNGKIVSERIFVSELDLQIKLCIKRT